MGITITKRDVIWSYLAKFLQIGSGLIVLPLVLRLLTPEEVGMNYLMLTVSSLVALMDFGFAPQFGRNFTYVNSGAKKLLKEGVEYSDNKNIDYKLLATILQTARYVYKQLSIICEIAMLSLGTIYMYYVTDGFSNIEDSFLIWILFSLSTYFNIYFLYYNSLLTGSGMVAEASISTILSRLSYIGIAITLLLLNCGLLSIVIANFIAPFIQRLYCYKKYFTINLKQKINISIKRDEIKKMFATIWYNAKKLGINFIGAYAINKSGMFIIGLYLPLREVGEYGLMVQLTTVLLGVSQVHFLTYQPKFADYRITGDFSSFTKLMIKTTLSYWIIMILGILIILFLGNPILEFIGSKTSLPSTLILLIYLISVALEGNHSNFATLIVTDNKVPFVKAGLLSGLIIVLLTVITLTYTNWGLLGVVFIPFLVQLSYNNWRWPLWIIKDLDYKIKTRYNVL